MPALWVDQIIVKLTASAHLDCVVGGENLTVDVASDMIDFLTQNRQMLLQVGKDQFIQFLTLTHEKNYEAAFLVLLEKMSADDIIKRMQLDAQELDAYQDRRDKFVTSIEQFALTTLVGIGSEVLIGLIITAV